MTVPVPAGSHPVSAIVTAPGRAIIAVQVSLASGRANMGNVTGTLPVANGGTGATNAEDARANLGIEDVVAMTTDQVDDVMDDDESIVSDNVVNGTIFSYIWGKLKTWAAAAFAPISHTHTQSQISDTPITVANGGTGATTAAGAKANLVDGQALTPASVAATGAVSGSSVSDPVGSLASLRESVSLTLKFTKLTTSQITIPNGQSVSLPDGYTSATMALICGYGYDGMRFTHLGAAGSINIPVAATSSTIGKLSVNVGTGTITNSAGVNVTIAAVYAVTMNM